jgi:hypothetical protein
MVDFSKFNEISNFNYNNTLTSNLSQINAEIISNTDTSLGPFWINGVLFVLFVFLFYRLNETDNANRYDITRSLFISSSIVLLGSIMLLISGLSSTIYPLYLYGMLTIITAIMLYNQKTKGL